MRNVLRLLAPAAALAALSLVLWGRLHAPSAPLLLAGGQPLPVPGADVVS